MLPARPAGLRGYTEQDYIIRRKLWWPISTLNDSWTIFERLMKKKFELSVSLKPFQQTTFKPEQSLVSLEVWFSDLLNVGRGSAEGQWSERCVSVTSAFFSFCHKWFHTYKQWSLAAAAPSPPSPDIRVSPHTHCSVSVVLYTAGRNWTELNR